MACWASACALRCSAVLRALGPQALIFSGQDLLLLLVQLLLLALRRITHDHQ